MKICSVFGNTTEELMLSEQVKGKDWKQLGKHINRQLIRKIEDGYDYFLVIPFKGVGLFVLGLLVKLKSKYPIEVISLLPYRDFYNNWDSTNFRLIDKYIKQSEIVILDEQNSMKDKFTSKGSYDSLKIKECVDYGLSKSDSALFVFNSDISTLTWININSSVKRKIFTTVILTTDYIVYDI